jgi:hypothetical protein
VALSDADTIDVWEIQPILMGVPVGALAATALPPLDWLVAGVLWLEEVDDDPQAARKSSEPAASASTDRPRHLRSRILSDMITSLRSIATSSDGSEVAIYLHYPVVYMRALVARLVGGYGYHSRTYPLRCRPEANADN